MSPFVHMGFGNGAVFVTRPHLLDATETEVDLHARGEWIPPERVRVIERSMQMAALELGQVLVQGHS